MAQAVIFDLDGVLVDSQPLHFDADLEVLARAGVSNALYKDVVENAGMSNVDRWQKYKKDFSLTQEVNQLTDIHVTVISQLLTERDDLKAIDGVRELLMFIKAQGIPMAVASSSSYNFVYKMLDKLSIREFFQLVVSGEDMKNSKPAPDIFIATAQKLGIPQENCIVIEDSQNGVTAAVAAKMPCVGYMNESSGKQDLTKATLVISDFNQLINNTDWLKFVYKKEGLIIGN